MADKSLTFNLYGEDKTASSAMEGVSKTAGSTSTKIGAVFSKMGTAIGGEFGEVVDKVSEGFSALGEAGGASLGTKLTATGGAVAGLGVAFQVMGSARQAAENQLKAAIEATGSSYDDYEGQIESTIKQQENLGHSEGDTQEALMKLTAATNDPKKALAEMGTVADLAAAQHQSLASAASQVARVYGGSGKVLKQYGITMQSAKDATAGLKTAEKSHESAVTELSKAQQKLTDLTAEDAGKTKLSVSQQIALRNAHEAVTTAQNKVASSAQGLANAQATVKKSTNYTQDALNQLGQKLNGQAKASVDTFSGRIDIIKAKLGDWAAMMGQKLGPALTTAGPIIMGVGAVIDSGMIPAIGRAIVAGSTWIVDLGVMVVDAAVAFATMAFDALAWAASMVVAGAMAILPFLPIILAVAAVGAAAYLLYRNWDTVWGFIKSIANDAWNFLHMVFSDIVNIAITPIRLEIEALRVAFTSSWSFMKAVANDAWTFLYSITQDIIKIAIWPIKTEMNLLYTAWTGSWNAIKSAGQAAWGFLNAYVFAPIGHAISAIGTGFNTVVGWIAGMPSRIKSAAVGMFDGVYDAFASAINFIANGWNNFSITLPSINTHIPGLGTIGGWTLDTPNIGTLPMLAKGGVATSPTLAMIGDGGEPEAVVPLSKAPEMGFGGGNSSRGGDTYNVTINGVVGDNEATARVMLQALQRIKGKGTKLGLA